MDTHNHHSSGDKFASILERAADFGWQQSAHSLQLGTNGPVLYTATYGTTAPYITSSFPQNAACSTYFMPPYQTALVQRAMSPYNLLITFINLQLLIPGLWQIAPKPHQAEKPVIVARSSASWPLDFIETVKQIRKELYAHGGISEDQNPPVLEIKDSSQWQKDVIQQWKPVS